jgi:hypothetical protein
VRHEHVDDIFVLLFLVEMTIRFWGFVQNRTGDYTPHLTIDRYLVLKFVVVLYINKKEEV